MRERFEQMPLLEYAECRPDSGRLAAEPENGEIPMPCLSAVANRWQEGALAALFDHVHIHRVGRLGEERQ